MCSYNVKYMRTCIMYYDSISSTSTEAEAPVIIAGLISLSKQCNIINVLLKKTITIFHDTGKLYR